MMVEINNSNQDKKVANLSNKRNKWNYNEIVTERDHMMRS